MSFQYFRHKYIYGKTPEPSSARDQLDNNKTRPSTAVPKGVKLIVDQQ
jgi:hypothetical protein